MYVSIFYKFRTSEIENLLDLPKFVVLANIGDNKKPRFYESRSEAVWIKSFYKV